MKEKNLRIVFMGTPDFAVESLKRLVDSHYNIVGVITAPDKPAGRGQKLQPSAVKVFAETHGLNVLQPANLKDEAFIWELKQLSADLQIVVAFRMLPEMVWAMPRLGTFNLHGSLLPQYRGAAPINWAVINGDKETGVTTFFLQHEIDTGNIIEQRRIDIEPGDNAGSVHDKLMVVGAQLVVDTVAMIEHGTVTAKPQPMDAELRKAPKIFKDDCRIDWSQNAKTIHNLVRGLSPYPAAWTEFVSADGTRLLVKVFETRIADGQTGKVGAIASDGKKQLTIACGNGALEILSLQAAGKKRMSVDEFLRGNKIEHYHRADY
jgi:methionyl-tRNA formyltransferase